MFGFGSVSYDAFAPVVYKNDKAKKWDSQAKEKENMIKLTKLTRHTLL